MMASNASQSTIKKIATPAANAPGAGIMCGIVSVWPLRCERPARTSGFLGFQPGVDADFCLEEFRDGAAGFGGFHGGVEFGLVRAGDLCDEVRMAFCDG